MALHPNLPDSLHLAKIEHFANVEIRDNSKATTISVCSISSLLAPLIGHNNYVILTLHKKATTLSVGGFILGSTKGRFVTTSHVMALHPNLPDSLHLAKIEHFANVEIRDNSKATTISVCSISSLLAPLIGHNNYVILTLHKKATTLSVGGFILGSTKGRFVTTSHVMALHPNLPDRLHLAKIEHFANVEIRHNSKATTISVWTACVQVFDEHQCKNHIP